MQRSVAHKITIPFFSIFLLLTLITGFAGYVVLNRAVVRQVNATLRSTAVNLKNRIEDKSVTNEDELLKKFKTEGFALSMSYDIDGMYLYIPNEDYTKVTYKGVVRIDGTVIYNEVTDIQNLTVDYALHPVERRVWEEELPLDYDRWVSDYLDNECVIIKIYGNDGTNYLMSIEKSNAYIRSASRRTFAGIIVLILLLFVLMSVILYWVIKQKVSKPAKAVSNAMSRFVVNGERQEIKFDEKQNDEFGVINQAFNKMADDIDEYVSNISRLNYENQRQKAEMDIAGKIQQGFLPPSRSKFKNVDIDSIMLPARDVGGDICDYKKLDDSHYYMMIADVAGKGISAALFTSLLLTCLRQSVNSYRDPAVILKYANDFLTEKNPEYVFVTAFVCIYDSETHTLTYANAGHNPPYLLSDELLKLDSSNGTVLGLFEGEEYENISLKIKPGDRLFLFTDGVTEAQNSEHEFFTEERLESLLKTISDEDLLPEVLNAVNGFAGSQERSDDITMLSASFRNEDEPEEVSLTLGGTIPEFEQIRSVISGISLPEDDRLSLCLAAEEIYVNICSYAYTGDDEATRKVTFTLKSGSDIEMTFRDNGMPFNPLENVKDDSDIEEYDPEETVGGLGVFIAANIADDIKYEYINGENTLTITKALKGEIE